MNSQRFEDIKQVKDGVAYNTRTSTHLGDFSPHLRVVFAADGPPKAAVEQLYRTRGGRYFIVHRQIPVWTPGRGHQLIDDIEPRTKQEAVEWLKQHLPDSVELTVLTLPFVKAETGASTTISLRLDSNLKEGIAWRAKKLDVPANSVYSLYLREGFANSIERPPKAPHLYATEDGVPLLNERGEPAYGGIPDNGDHIEIFRAELAAACRETAHMIPARLRKLLALSLSKPEPGDEKVAAIREAVLSDIKRWLDLVDATTWA